MKEYVLDRIKRCREWMSKEGLDGLVFLNCEKQGWVNVFYYSGLQGSSAVVVISQDRAILSVDPRYTSQAQQQSPLELRDQKTGVPNEDVAADIIAELGLKRCGYDGESLSAANFVKLSQHPVEWVDAIGHIVLQRRHKDKQEIELIRTAADIASKAYLKTLESVKPGMKEAELAKRIELEISRLDGEGVWHNMAMIVASGVRSAMPHGIASKKEMQMGEQVTVDWGAIYGAYMSDLTRNFSLGPVADKEFLKIHEVLIDAHRSAAAALKPGVIGRDIDAIARKVIGDAGYGEYFGHGLGHSFGLDIHENPRLSPLYAGELMEGDLITVEPGIYIPERGGLRLEDDYLITATGAERLSSMLPQEFVQLDL